MDRDLDNGKESVIDTEGRGGALVWHFGVAVYGTYWHCGAWLRWLRGWELWEGLEPFVQTWEQQGMDKQTKKSQSN